MNDNPTNIVILPALSNVEGSERSLPAVAGNAKVLCLPRLPRLPTEPRGLRSRPLWSAAVPAALHSCRPSTPLRRGGPGVAASMRRSPFAMNDNLTTTVILSERSLPAVAGDAKDLYLPHLPRLLAEVRGLRSRPLWSAAVPAALQSCRLSTPPRRSGLGVAASKRRSPYAMSKEATS